MADPSPQEVTLIHDILHQHNGLQTRSIDLVETDGFGSTYNVEIVPQSSDIMCLPTASSVAIPKGTDSLIVRLPDLRSNLNIHLQVRNQVAALKLLREALTPLPRSIVPKVYDWSADHERPAWILLEALQGTKLSKVFHSYSADQQRFILSQLATVVRLIQSFGLPDTVKDYGGVCLDKDGNLISGPLSWLGDGPFSSLAEMYKAEAVHHLKLSDQSPILDGWRDDGLRENLDALIANGFEKFLPKAGSLPRVLVHGNLTLDCFLINPNDLTLTMISGGEMAHIATPINEYFHSFYDLYNFLPGPFVANPQNSLMHKALIYDFPEPLPAAQTGQGSTHQFGSGVGIDWQLSTAFAEQLDSANALRPARISDAEKLTMLYWFVQDICPPYLLNQSVEKAKQLQVKYKKDGRQVLGKYLAAWGY